MAKAAIRSRTDPLRKSIEATLEWLDQFRMTLALVALLLLWYDFQVLITVVLDLNAAAINYWFKTTALFGATPGWVLSVISHAYPPRYDHVLGNLFALLVIGGAVERHVSWRVYIGLFFGIGILAALTEVAVGLVQGEQLAVMGASAAIFGLLMVYAVHYLRYHRAALSFPRNLTSLDDVTTFLHSFLVTVVPVLVLLQLFAQLLGFVPAGDSAVVSHLVACLLGSICGVVPPCDVD